MNIENFFKYNYEALLNNSQNNGDLLEFLMKSDIIDADVYEKFFDYATKTLSNEFVTALLAKRSTLKASASTNSNNFDQLTEKSDIERFLDTIKDSGFNYSKNNKGAIKIKKYKATSKNIRLPGSFPGHKVEFDRYCFNNSSFDRVTIPCDYVNNTNFPLFYGCLINELVLEEGIDSFSVHNLSGQIRVIKIPASLTQLTISNEYDWDTLEITDIYSWLTKDLSLIFVDAKNPRFENGPYNRILYDKIDKICYKLCNNVDIPEDYKVLMPCTIDSKTMCKLKFNRFSSKYNVKMNPDTVIVDYEHKVHEINIQLPDTIEKIYPFFLNCLYLF